MVSHHLQAQSINSLPAELPGSTPDDITPSDDPLVSIPTRYTPSSNRRLQFEKTFRNSPMHRASKSSTTSISIALPRLAQSDLKSLSEDGIARLSFDQSLRTPSSRDQVRVASFDSARPYKEMQQSPIYPKADLTPPTYPKGDEALPVLGGNTIERNVSTASTIAVVSVPRIAKRYVPNPIYIRKSVDKHRSLPTELPHVQSQSSLTEDLADWIAIPHGQSEKLQSTEWGTSSVVASSSMSVVSCPVVSTMPLQHPDVRQEVLEQRREAKEAGISTPDLTTNDTKSIMQQVDARDPASHTPFTPGLESVARHERADSIRSTSSIFSRKPLSPAAKVSVEVGIPEILAVVSPSREEAETHYMTTHNAELTLLQQRMLSQTYITNDGKNEPEAQAIGGSSVEDDTFDGASQTYIEIEREETQADAALEPKTTTALLDEPTTEQQQGEQEDEPHTLAEPEIRPTLLDQPTADNEEQAPPPAQPIPAETNIPARPSPEPIITAQPPTQITDVDKIALTPPPVRMTAQAKRRAAHQRRMELAFGKA